MIAKTSDISLSISLPQHSWDEVDQINVIFGQTIVIVHNSSYMQGFAERVERTTISKMRKTSDINPCVLCDDVYAQLKSDVTDVDWAEEDALKIIKRIQAEIQKVMEIETQ
jgi:hypothetical protein